MVEEYKATSANLLKVIETVTAEGPYDVSLEDDFLRVAKEWADFSLTVFRDNLLKRALDISVALAEFSAQICKELHDES